MRSNRATFIAKIIAIVAVLAWFVATNHCALSALVEGWRKVAAAPESACSHCPAKENGSDQSGGMTGCCKDVKATASAKGLGDFQAAVCGTLIAVLEMPAADALAGAQEVGSADTGPPRPVSFAEAVLARSHRSHAPPVPA